MKRSELTAKITAFTNGGANTAAEFRSYETDVTENTYATVRIETSTLPVWTNAADATNRPFWFQIIKEGRGFRLIGWLRNGAIGSTSASSVPENTVWLEIKPTVLGSPSDLIPDNVTDPLTGLAILFPFVGKTPLGTECMFAFGYRASTNKYEIFSRQTVPPNTTSISAFYINEKFTVKD